MRETAARVPREDDHGEISRAEDVACAGAASPTRVTEGYRTAYAENGRRTITITGHPVPPRRRPSQTQAQIQARPDRIALWAFLLGLFLVFMAVATANAAAL